MEDERDAGGAERACRSPGMWLGELGRELTVDVATS